MSRHMKGLRAWAAASAVACASLSAGEVSAAELPGASAASAGPALASSRPVPAGWSYSRSDGLVRVVKGDIEELWRRESQGQVSFERIFHADQRRVFYSAGELRTMGLELDWARAVEWIAQSGLPERAAADGATTALPDAGEYLRLDASDLGDMDYDDFARKAEAYDVKLGWRQAHEH